MSAFVRCSTLVYRAVLFLYPFELRLEFGNDMAWMFGEDLKDALERRCFGDVARVWWRALSEVPWIALPGRIRLPGLAVPAMGMMLQLVVVAGMLAIATFAQEALPHDVLHGAITLRR